MPQPHAVISCLHANLAALEAVLADIDQQGIATITCLGDLVGYGPQPNEVVDLVRRQQRLQLERRGPATAPRWPWGWRRSRLIASKW